MRFGKELLVASALFSGVGVAYASDPCTLSLKPETSGFFLNPVLEKVVVVEAKGTGCSLMVNDEILQLNSQVVPGQRARVVMGYWKSLGKRASLTFKVRRAGAILAVSQ